jgi:hypothetical protein
MSHEPEGDGRLVTNTAPMLHDPGHLLAAGFAIIILAFIEYLSYI